MTKYYNVTTIALPLKMGRAVFEPPPLPAATAEKHIDSAAEGPASDVALMIKRIKEEYYVHRQGEALGSAGVFLIPLEQIDLPSGE